MNHRGQITILYTLMMAVVVILFVIGIAPTLKIFTEEQLKQAGEIKLPYSFIKITDNKGEER